MTDTVTISADRLKELEDLAANAQTPLYTRIAAWALDALRQPSTCAGLAAVLGLVGIRVAPEMQTQIVEVAGWAGSLLLIFVSEKK